MRTFEQISALRTYLRGLRQERKTVGFVPTMGALHAGHLSLVQRAKGDCDVVVVSIFVNPTQFGPQEDYSKYPRDTSRDMQLTSNAGVDALFLPTNEDIYPAGFQTWVDVTDISQPLEGVRRPGHYRGVATIVTKLLNIVQPDIAYFGQKDYQQFLVVERLARDLNMPSTIQMVPTLRETDGLALSSRNAYLSEEERSAATLLSRLLSLAGRRVLEGVSSAQELRRELEALVSEEPLAALEYIELANPDTLQPVENLEEGLTLVVAAIKIGKTRLIDNALIAPEGMASPRPRVSRGV